jgi:hypothetical protein
MKSVLLAALVSIGLLSCPGAYADMINDLVFVTETGTAFYYSNSECKNAVKVGRAYKCTLNVDPTKKDVSKVTLPGGLKAAYGVNPGTILLTEPKGGNSDLIEFPGTVQSHGLTLAIEVLFYSLADDKDTDKSKDTDNKAIFNVTVDGPCETAGKFTAKAGKTCSIAEKDLTGESDVVNSQTLTFDGTQKDVPSLTGASGYAFTVTGKELIGATPVYSETVIRYIFVSDCGPEPPGSDTICSAPTPEPATAGPMGASLLVWLTLVQRRWLRGRFGIRF